MKHKRMGLDLLQLGKYAVLSLCYQEHWFRPASNGSKFRVSVELFVGLTLLASVANVEYGQGPILRTRFLSNFLLQISLPIAADG